MAILFWDASGLAKRYTFETGTEVANAIFAASAGHRMATSALGYAETFSILVRRRNAAVIGDAEFEQAVTALTTEVMIGGGCLLVPIGDDSVFEGTQFIAAHNLNATDAAILAALLRLKDAEGLPHEGLVLIASDRRLLRAAEAEGVLTINPETTTPDEVVAFLAALANP